MDWLMNRVWKPSRLLRLAWPVRVVGEEQFRIAATGFDSAVSHPASYWAMVMGTRQDGKTHRFLDALETGMFGDVEDETARFARIREHLFPEAMTDDLTGTPFGTIAEFTNAMNRGKRTNWMIPTGAASGGRFQPFEYRAIGSGGTPTPGFHGAWADLFARAHSDEPQLGRVSMGASEFRVEIPKTGIEWEPIRRDLGRALLGQLAIESRLAERARTYRRRRAVQAAEKAIANPLLDEISLNGAKGVLINITGGHDLTLFELDEAANIIREKVDPEANIIVGSTLDTAMEGRIRVSVVATGIDASAANKAEPPVARRPMGAPLTLTPVRESEPPRAAAPVYVPTPEPVMEERMAFEDEQKAQRERLAAKIAKIEEESGQKIELPPMPEIPPPPISKPAPVRTAHGTSFTREETVVEIEDEKLIPREYLMPNMSKIKPACKAGKKIPGVRTYVDRNISYRTV